MSINGNRHLDRVLGEKGILVPSEYPTETAKYICESLYPEWRDLFLEKNAGYGEMHRDEGLGLKAQYLDMHRKVGKLRRAWWDGLPIGKETDREVLMDLIGHCFLALSLIDEDAAIELALMGDGERNA